MRLNVTSEVGTLRAVLLGSVRTFRPHPPINATQRHYYPVAPPRLPVLLAQQAAFVEVLERRGVSISWVPPLDDCPNQLNVRDIATVIGTTLVIGALKEPIRQREPCALDALLPSFDADVVRLDHGIVEGGDILLDGARLYVGLSERTDPTGLAWLERTFGSRFEITPIRLSPTFLHLDVVFNLLGRSHALLYPPALADDSLNLLTRRYEIVEVTAAEQFGLATNVLSLSPETVVSAVEHRRLNQRLRAAGFEVVEVEYGEIVKIGGSFRCGTCPLVRDAP